MTWCPNCINFGIECSVDLEEYGEPCTSYIPIDSAVDILKNTTVTIEVALHPDDDKAVKAGSLDYRTAVVNAVVSGRYDIVDISR